MKQSSQISQKRNSEGCFLCYNETIMCEYTTKAVKERKKMGQNLQLGMIQTGYLDHAKKKGQQMKLNFQRFILKRFKILC